MAETAATPLPPICDLKAAAPLKAALLAALKSDGPLLVDVSAVRQFGTPCAQVLLSADRSALQRRSDSGLRLTGASAAFTDAMQDLGLDDALERWSER